MPLTKKRGAIFAIYADSPVKTPTRTGEPAALGKGVHPSDKAAAREPSPSKTRAAPPRRALSAIQPSKLQVAISEPSTKGENLKVAKAEKSGKNENRGALMQKSSRVLAASLKPSATSKPASLKPTAKRQFEIFTPPSPEASLPSSTSPKRSTVAAQSAAEISARSEPPPSPPKRQRPKSSEKSSEERLQKEDGQDDFKENCPPAPSLDSPASRTRSRTAAPSHLQSRQRNSRPPVMRVLQAEDVLREGQPFVGDGRGTLSLRRGRATASVLERALPLSDVSRFYGATGIEPEGFRYEGQVSRSTF